MFRTFSRAFRSATGFMVLVLSTGTALANANVFDGTRAAARNAGYEGVYAYQAGDYATAVSKLEKAYGVVQIPTLGLWYARALVKSGKLVQASERYREVLRLELKEGKIREQRQAQLEAQVELDTLLPSIPALTVTLEGADEHTAITLDGDPIPSKLLGLATPVNPGEHVVQAVRGTQVTEGRIILAEAESRSIALTLPPLDEAAAPPPLPTLAPSPVRQPTSIRLDAVPKPPPTSSAPSSPLRTVAWASVGFGGVATIVGSVSGLLVLAKQRDLKNSDACREPHCLRTEHDRVTSYNQLRTVSTVGFVLGAVGAVTGVTLLLATPKPKEARLTAWVGLGDVGVGGTFQ